MSSTTERLSIEGPAGALEAVVEETGAASESYAIVCHPHPLMGGTMDNKVVTTVARGLRETGIPTLRFNFRGVGASAGTFDHGVGETLDAHW
jgi:alpha/beta superfamily hydrolase